MSEADESEIEVDLPSEEAKGPEHERPLVLVCAILGLGPLALPLVWKHSRLKWYWKLYITVGVIALTWGCIVLTKVMWDHLKEQWEIIQELNS